MPRPSKTKGAQPANDNAKTTGYYSDKFTPDELARVAAFVSDPTLDDELWLMRVLNARLLAYINAAEASDAGLPLADLTHAAEALATGTGRVAQLLRARRALSGDAADGLTGAIATALDEISTELGLEL